MLSVFVCIWGGGVKKKQSKESDWVCFFFPLSCVLTWMCHSANWKTDKWSGLNAHMETGRLLEKCPHPKTAGPMAVDQKSTLKHLLFTLAIFTGKGWNREGARKRRYPGDDHNLAYSLNAALYRKTFGLFRNVPQIFTNWTLNWTGFVRNLQLGTISLRSLPLCKPAKCPLYNQDHDMPQTHSFWMRLWVL